MANLSYPHETLTTASHTTTLHDALPIWPYVTKAVHRIELGASPIVLVNGSKDADYAKEDIAFEKRSVWKILVGGAKLRDRKSTRLNSITFRSRMPSTA